MDINKLVIYRNLEHQELFEEIACPMGHVPREERPDAFHHGGKLVELAVSYGSEGSLWYCSLVFYLASNENACTTTRKIIRATDGSLDELAREDFGIFKALFDYGMLEFEPPGAWRQLSAYRPAGKGSRVFNKRIRDCIADLAVQLKGSGDVEEFQSHVTEFYREFGMGKFRLNKVFHIVEKNEGQTVLINPIINVEHIYFKDIVGYELQKRELIENTETSVGGREVSNVFLLEDAGTGGSSGVRIVLNKYYFRRLHIIEVYRYQFKALSDVLEQIKNGNYKLVIYMDGLSSEDCELKYRYLKAILKGGLGKWPDNALIYATSNWRHSIREKFSDKRELDDELHNSGTVQGKLSSVFRFGATIYFSLPDKRQFETTVKALADRCHLDMPRDELYREVNKQELSHGDLSGHTASQSITHLLGRQRIDQY